MCIGFIFCTQVYNLGQNLPIIMRVMALFFDLIFCKYLRVGEDGPGWGHLCHTDTFLVLFLLKNIDCGYSLELPRRGSSNEYPQSLF